MADSLRERLVNALTWRTDTEVDVDSVLTIFAEYLTSDATVERVARALMVHHEVDWNQPLYGHSLEKTRDDYRALARAALAAALAPDKEADRASS